MKVVDYGFSATKFVQSIIPGTKLYWSIPDVDGYRFLDVAIKGRCVISYRTYDTFSHTGNTYYCSPLLNNPSWMDVARIADAAIKHTGDYHHIYLEAVRFIAANPNGVAIYELRMGS